MLKRQKNIGCKNKNIIHAVNDILELASEVLVS